MSQVNVDMPGHSNAELGRRDSKGMSKLAPFTTQRQITVIGSLNMDFIWVLNHFPQPSETLKINKWKTSVGGKGAIQAIACARLSRPSPVQIVGGSTQRHPKRNDHVHHRRRSIDTTSISIKVNMVGAVGSDRFGAQVVEALHANNVDTTHVLRQEGGETGVASIAVGPKGENNVLVFAGANDELHPDQMEIPPATVEQSIRKAADAKVPVLLNAAPASALPSDLYPKLEHLIVNKIEAEALLSRQSTLQQHQREDRDAMISEGEKLCTALLERGTRYVVVTMGGFGGVAGEKSARRDPVTFSYEAVHADDVLDTTGCGAVFIGAYAVDYIRQKSAHQEFDIKRAVHWAARAAAASVSSFGSLEGIPWKSTLEHA
ncbi:putative ribokinase [Exophiala dermatitidis]|nr:putative ribokinase [Exophiala dermatitidis]